MSHGVAIQFFGQRKLHDHNIVKIRKYILYTLDAPVANDKKVSTFNRKFCWWDV